MESYPGGLKFLVRKPSAFAPVMMSLAALAIVVAALATGAVDRQSDQGVPAHIWQLLMAGQLPLLIWFAIHWLRRSPKSGLPILGLQVLALVAAALPVWLNGL